MSRDDNGSDLPISKWRKMAAGIMRSTYLHELYLCTYYMYRAVDAISVKSCARKKPRLTRLVNLARPIIIDSRY